MTPAEAGYTTRRPGVTVRWLAVASLISLTVAAVACSGSGQHEALSATPDPPCTNGATATAIVGANVADLTAVPIKTQLALAGSVTPRALRLIDDEPTCRIRKLLLGTADLGGDWMTSELSRSEFGQRVYADRSGTCDVPYTYLVAGLRLVFQNGEFPTPRPRVRLTPEADSSPDEQIPRLLQDAILLFKPETASEFMNATVRSCGLDASPTSDSATPERGYHLSRFSFPSIGDDTIAFTLPAEHSFEVLIRRGDVIEDLAIYSQDDPTSDLDAIARLQDGKITARGDYLLASSTAARPSPTAALDPQGTQAVLQSVLLGPDELPDHWLPGHTSTQYDENVLEFCGDAPPLPTGSHVASASYSGAGLGFTGSIGIGLARYQPHAADSFMSAVTSGTAFPDGCDGTVRKIDVQWKLDRLLVKPLGDESVAWRAIARHTATSGPTDLPLVSDIELDFDVIRRGDVVALIIESHDAPRPGDLGFLDREITDNLSTFAAKIDEKLANVVDELPPQ